MIKAVLLDIDNTLLSFDGYVKEALQSGFAHFGLPAYEPYMFDIFELENSKLWRLLEMGKLDFETLKKIRFVNVFKALGFECDGPAFEEYFRASLYDSAILMPHVEETLEFLKEEGYVLAVASNGPYEQQVHRLQIAKIQNCFSQYFISEKIGYSKPSKEFFDYCLQHLEGISADQCLMVGDSLSSDICGGANAGMVTCFVGEAHTIEADYCISDLSKLKEVLKKING